ncbi:hypothetical protein H2200_009957 [Cladophialophora chaetospira]|uniref:Transcription factor domain-containing protein n=1 Tax=Cladophialophora chaetospira TaxID=386627 RepID=A0AA39CEC5_9EURO|nr:hypothetical protein H2200_009957 [Cladophialophora chaetospira]
MPLKRGLEREACDLSLRVTEGQAACSQCARREESCRLDDSDDIRVQRRRRVSAGVVVKDTIVEGSQPCPDLSAATFARVSQVQSHPAEDANVAPSQYQDDLFMDDTFDLSLDNILFLDQIFMGDSGPAEWSSSLLVSNEQDPPSTVDNEPANTQGQHEQSNASSAEATDLFPWPSDLSDPTILTAALRSYFNFAASFLSIILEDAFWQDYHAGRCSQALVYAIACRGLPFTTATKEWDLQRRLAWKFREAFLQARSSASDDGMIRLDDLEALALMIGFEYEEAGSPPLHSSLGRLFLTHESLVLMTLQSRICDRTSTGSDPSAILTRAGERRALLYWHVYGLDAFHCLDRKQVSYIPDDDANRSAILPQHEAKSYFDAILALAIIARKTVQTLCSPAAKRRGVESKDVYVLYEELYHWRDNSCPEHLRRHEGGGGRLANENLGSPNANVSKKHIQLHRAVLWALEIDYLLQIEDCVSRYGIQDSTSLEAETIAIRVEYESVRALTDMIDICRWMKQHEIRGVEDKRHSLIDLAPSPLRNVCAGLCFWSCQRGIEFCRRDPLTLLQCSSAGAHTGGDHARINRKRRHVKTYTDAARLLRDAVATAISHHDTSRVVERLDKQRALLETELDNMQA